jgi:signal peptidase I
MGVSREFLVRGSSMLPTYAEDTCVRLSPLAYLWRTPRRGEIVGLRCPEAEERFELKRIIGLPGECVSWKGPSIWVNGVALDEPYAMIPPHSSIDKVQMLDLGPGEYFVCGDNRLCSRDSRAYGPVWRSDILGLVTAAEPVFEERHIAILR